MTDLITSFLLGQYYIKNGRILDFSDWVAQGISITDYRTSDLDIFLSVYQWVKDDSSPSCQTIIDLIQKQPFTPRYLPFYLLPLAFSPTETLEKVVSKVETIVTAVVHDKQLQLDTLVMVASIKWAAETHSSAFPYLQRCNPAAAYGSAAESVLFTKAIKIVDKVVLRIFDTPPTLHKVLCQACEEKNDVPVLAVLATALFQADILGDYNAKIDSPYSTKMPFFSEYKCEWDPAVAYGYMRLDGYIAWVMQSKKEVLDGSILLDYGKTGPDRDELRVWHWLDKHLDWSQIYQSIDEALKEHDLWGKNQGWQNRIESRHIDYTNKVVEVNLSNSKYPVKFAVPMKYSSLVIDKESVKKAFTIIPIGGYRSRQFLEFVKTFEEEDV